MIVEDLSEWACDRCGKVYNPYLGDTFWHEIEAAGEHELICDDCRRDLDEGYTGAAARP